MLFGGTLMVLRLATVFEFSLHPVDIEATFKGASTDAKRESHYIMIGGSLSGLTATIKICEDKVKVTLVSYQPVKRSHSVSMTVSML